MKNIIFIAPPAAGKGTQSKLVSQAYNIPHISIGDIMRSARDPNTEIGKIIIKYQDERKLVPLDITLNLLKTRITKEDCNNGYILDGFPRNLEQAYEYEKILKSLNKEIGVVIFLDIDKNLALERTLSRMICPSCGATYNLLNEELKPKKEGICDKCNSNLTTRTDDNKNTFIKGFNTYMKETLPLIEYYQNKGLLKIIKVNKNKSTQDIFNQIKEIIS